MLSARLRSVGTARIALTHVGAHWSRASAPALRLLQRCLSSASSASDAASRPRLSYMQEQMQLEQQEGRLREQETTTSQAEEVAPATRPADATPAVTPALARPPVPPAAPAPPRPSIPVSPPLHLSQLLARPPADWWPQPKQTMSPMQILAQAGLIKQVGSHIFLLPTGKRVLQKLERLLSEELTPLQLQQLELHGAPLPVHAPPVMSLAAQQRQAAEFVEAGLPYPASFATEMPLLTQLLLADFQLHPSASTSSSHQYPHRPTVAPAPLKSGGLMLDTPHPPLHASANSPHVLWSSGKTTRDVLLLHTKHSLALDQYHSLLDAFARVLSDVGLKALVVETQPSIEGPHAIDADLAHEVHVAVGGSANSSAAGGLIKCDQCEYVAKTERAVSLATEMGEAADLDSSSAIASPQNLPPALHQFFREWVLDHLLHLFPPHVLESLHLTAENPRWKCEIVVQKQSWIEQHVAVEGGAQQQQPIVHLVLLRADHELNMHAVGEHIGLQQLERIADPLHTAYLLRHLLPSSLHAHLHSLLPELADYPEPATSIRFDPHPELLVDQALIPEGLDLDLEVMQQQEREQQEEQWEQEEEQWRADRQGREGEDADESPALLERMEKSLSSSASKFAAGESIDLVQLEMAAKGQDPLMAKAKLTEEAMKAQKEEYEEREKEEENRKRVEQEAKKLEEEEALPEYDPSLAASDSAAPSAPSTSSVSSALIPHFEYSKQGFFRLAHPGERCSMYGCEGTLEHVHTNVLANAAFVGKQDITPEQQQQDVQVEERSKGMGGKKSKIKPMAPPAPLKKQFLHSSFARFSLYDLFTHLALKHFHVPSSFFSPRPPTTPSTGLSPDSLSMLHLPPLLAPYQVALLPVLADAANSGPNARDLRRTKQPNINFAQVNEEILQASQMLHQDILNAAATEPPTPEQVELGISFPPLEGDLLLDDRYDLSINARVKHAVGLGIPILVLLQPRALPAGFASLVINKPGISLEPRRVPIKGLAGLINKMIRSNYAHITQERKNRREQKKKEEKEKAKKEKEMQQQAAQMPFTLE